jgi:dihydrodipicolinate synthase/N-acetylneuraminate lyase
MRVETLMRMKDAEHVVTVKWSVPEGEDFDQIFQVADTFNIIDNSGRTKSVHCHRNGGVGYISQFIAVHPAHDLEVFGLMEQGRYEEAQAKIDEVSRVLGPWVASAGARSGGYRQGKALLAASGRPMGPPRPPTLPCDETEIAEARALLQELGWVREAQTVAAG